ncbi:MAG: phage tail protein [Burkholderiales bacterium]|nr:phage tail protein [Burkholderiales bacterium]
MNVTIRTDFAATIARMNRLKAGLGDRAIRQAVTRTAEQARTQMSRAIRQEYNITAQLVNQRLQVRRASFASRVTFTAVLLGNPDSGGKNRSMNVVHFLERSVSLAEARRRAKAGTLAQLRFKIKRQGGKQTIEGAFLANKGRTVFAREGKARLPIKPVQTIGVPQMFNARRNRAKVEAWIRVNFPRILADQVRYFLTTVR